MFNTATNRSLCVFMLFTAVVLNRFDSRALIVHHNIKRPHDFSSFTWFTDWEKVLVTISMIKYFRVRHIQKTGIFIITAHGVMQSLVVYKAFPGLEIISFFNGFARHRESRFFKEKEKKKNIWRGEFNGEIFHSRTFLVALAYCNDYFVMF